MCLFTTVIQILFDQSAITLQGSENLMLLCSFDLLPSMLLVGICGIIPSMLSFVAVFIYKWFVQSNIAYAETIILLSDIVIYHFVRSGRMRHKKKAALFTVWLILFVGPAWQLLVILLEGRMLTEFTPMHLLLSHVCIIPECVIAILTIYLFLNKAPDKFKHYASMGLLYSGDYKNDFAIRSNSKISRRISALITVEGLVLGIGAAVFANSLIPDISDNISRENAPGFFRDYMEDKSVSGSETVENDEAPGFSVNIDIFNDDMIPVGQEAAEDMDEMMEEADERARFVMNRRGLAFDLKLVLLIMCVAIPFIIFANHYAQRFIALPITRMAQKLKEFCDAPQENKRDKLVQVNNLDIRNTDEIGNLYHTIEDMAGNITSYVDQVVREQKLEEDLRVAQKASEAKSNFLSNMSHEIRTPINAVLGLDEMILREADNDDILKYATDIQNAGKTLLSLINDILDSSKLEAGKMEILPVEYDLSSTINDLINMISVKAKDKGLDFIVNVDEDTPYLLCGDEIRIKQVITNILSNAVKYTQTGSVTLNIGYEKTSEETIDLKVSVVDTGIGIKEEDLSKLYSPFERIEEVRNRTIEGTGLGMSIVKQILALMDTQLVVKSVYGEGSDFSFTVSQEVVKWDRIGNFNEMYERAKNSIKEYHERFRAPKAEILIVDDTQMNLTVATALLKQTRVRIDTATSGFMMLDMIRQKKYDVIFLDHRMPEMDGIETLEKMKADNDHLNVDTPIIALTANAISGVREMYLEAGFSDYLSKPIDGAKFEKLLEEYLPAEKVLHEGDEGYGEVEKPADDTKGEAESSHGESHLRTMLSGTTLLDLDKGIAACNGEDIFEAALKDYLSAVPEKSKQIERYAKEKDYTEYAVRVHALKSSSRLIGADSLSTWAEKLENAGYAAKGGDEEAIALIEAETGDLVKLYRSYFDKLGSLFLGSEDDDVRPVIEKDELLDAMNAVREFAEAFDFDSADNVISMLRDYRIPDEYEEAFEQVKRKLSDVDQAALLEALDFFS